MLLEVKEPQMKGRRTVLISTAGLLLAALVFLGGCVTVPNYSPTKESSEEYTVSYTDEEAQ
jgi:hypothetical protein